MFEPLKTNSSNAKKAPVYRNNFHELAASSIKEFVSHVGREYASMALIELAAQAIVTVTFRVEYEHERDWIFAEHKKTTLRGLKYRVDHLLSELGVD